MLDVGPLNSQALHAASVSICLFGIQVNCLDSQVLNRFYHALYAKYSPLPSSSHRRKLCRHGRTMLCLKTPCLASLRCLLGFCNKVETIEDAVLSFGPAAASCMLNWLKSKALGFCNKVETIEDAVLSFGSAAASCMLNWLKSKAPSKSLSLFQSQVVQIMVVKGRGTLHAMFCMPCRC